jgi:hypothetical protein
MPALQLIAVAGRLCSFLLMVSDESVVEMMRSRDGKVGASATNKECDHQAYAKPANPCIHKSSNLPTSQWRSRLGRQHSTLLMSSWCWHCHLCCRHLPSCLFVVTGGTSCLMSSQ